MKAFREYLRHIRMVSRNAQLFLLGTFFLGISQSVFFTMANLYFEELTFTRTQIGAFRSVRQLGVVIMAIPTVFLITRLPVKIVLTVSAIVSAVGYLGQCFGQSFMVILAFAGLLGTAAGVINLSMAPLFMRSSSKKERIYLFGWHRVIRMAVAVGATLLAGEFIARLVFYYDSTILGYRYVLAIASLFSLLAVIPFLLVRTSELSDAEEHRKFNLFKIKNKVTILKVCTPEFLIGAGAGLFIPFVNLYFKDVLNAGPSEVAKYMSIARFTMLIGFVVAPVVAHRLGLLKSVVTTELLSIPFLAIMATWTHFGMIMIVFAYVARQSLMNMSQPVASNFAMEVVPPREQAITNSMKLLVSNGGRALFTFVGGFTINNFGFKPVIVGTASFYLAAALSYILFFRHHPLYLPGMAESKKAKPEPGFCCRESCMKSISGDD